MEHLKPRTARVVTLTVPTERERRQWYFQRYTAHLPTAGEVVFFYRSWYNRADVERSWADPDAVGQTARVGGGGRTRLLCTCCEACPGPG